MINTREHFLFLGISVICVDLRSAVFLWELVCSVLPEGLQSQLCLHLSNGNN